MALKTYSGSCHCGAVRYEADLDLADGTNRCSCSYCRKVRAWFAFAKGADRFRLDPRATATEYRWTPPGYPHPNLTYAFCPTCGVRLFARGELEALGGVFHAVAIASLDVPLAELADVPVRYIDGANGRYEDVPQHTAAL